MTSLRVALVLLLWATASAADNPRVAIIIDDLGYSLTEGMRAISLPGPVAYAVLPGTPRAATLAEYAHEQGKEVLLHLPLQANNDDGKEEPESIALDMSQAQLDSIFDVALASVPHAIGVNSHRGSLLTRHPGHMQWLMEAISAHGQLFFIDSFTTHRSVALQLARENGIDATRRDVFLDPDNDPATVAREFERMKRLARQRGAAVAIGHPYPATLELLEKELPTLEEEGFELVRISELVR